MADQAVSFRSAAARNRSSLAYTIPWVTGSRPVIQMNNRGYLNALQLRFALVVTTGAAGTVTDDDAANSNFLPFVGLKSPQGEYIWSTNSRDLYDFAYRLFGVVTPAGQPNYAMWAKGNVGAQNVNFTLPIPVAMNDGYNFDVGNLMRQVSNNFFYLEVQMANPTDLLGAGTATITGITGNVYVNEVYYDAIDPNTNPPVIPPSFSEVVRLRSLQSQSLQNGQNDISYAVGPILTDAFLRVMNNGAADGTLANLTNLTVQLNKGTTIDFRTGVDMAVDSYNHLGVALRKGVYHEDFFDDRSEVNVTSARDFINSNKAAQLDFLLQYGGAPAGSSYIQQFFRELVALGG